MHTLAGWSFSENDGIPCGVIGLRFLCGLFSLSLMWDALSQSVV